MCHAQRVSGDASSSVRLRVALDATPLLGTLTGIGVSVREIFAALARRDEFDLSAYAVTLRHRSGLDEVVPEGVTTTQRHMAARPLMELWARMNHPRIERFLGSIDVVHGTNFVVPPSLHAARLVSVHDLTFVRYPEMCQPATLRFGDLLRRALRSGAHVHADSGFVAGEIKEHFGISSEQVSVVHLAPPPRAAPDFVGAADLVPESSRFILSVGTAEPRKDLPSLIRAFDLVGEEDPDIELVLVGARGWGADALDEALGAMKHRARVRLLGYVSDELLSALLERSRALAYPSLYEGFGLPPLQAMAAGVPVVATRVGSIPEVVGGACLLVEPGAVEDLAHALLVAVNDEPQRHVLITAGSARVQDFTWEKTAAGLSELYRRLARR